MGWMGWVRMDVGWVLLLWVAVCRECVSVNWDVQYVVSCRYLSWVKIYKRERRQVRSTISTQDGAWTHSFGHNFDCKLSNL